MTTTAKKRGTKSTTGKATATRASATGKAPLTSARGTAKAKARATATAKPTATAKARRSAPLESPARPTGASPLGALAGRELRLDLPKLGAMSPGLASVFRQPETHESADGDALSVLGTNMAGLWFVLADDGSVHLVDDCERELGTRVFPSVEAFAEELRRQNVG